MQLQFNTLFTINISHSYYQDENGCKDFDFLFPADTMQWLRNGKLIAKRRDGRLFILFETTDNNEKSPLVPMAEKTLRIGLKLLNPYFSNFTDLSSFKSSTIPLYSNAANSDKLNMEKKVVTVGRLFNHSLTVKDSSVKITLKNSADQILRVDTIESTSDRSSVSYDLTGHPAGLYEVVETGVNNNTEATAYYSDAELHWQGIFGIIEINIDNSFYNTFPELRIEFTAKKEILKYYLVAKNYTEAEYNQLQVVDKSGESPTVIFNKKTPSPEISSALLDNNMVLFESRELVARQEKARRKIQLQKNGGVLIENLPQPGADKANADLIIQLSKPS
ncbi:MAG: hypothetical protein U1F76_27905 [Candidatus Competibacteraceae bacterium]